MTPTRRLLAAVFVALLPTLAVQAQRRGHEHGVVRLDIAAEARKLSLQLETPLDSLVGFERAPRTDVERKRVEAALARLKAADALFMPDPAGGCTLASVELTSGALGLGTAPAPGVGSEHAELDASIEFECTDAAKLKFINADLFSAFAAMQRVDIQAATPAGQFKRTLKRPASRIVLAR